MRTNEKVRSIDDSTFQEASPPPERNRPLEWRRSFNVLNLELRDASFEYVLSVNDLDFLAPRRKSGENDELLIAAAEQRRQLCLTARVSSEGTRDKIFRTSETSKGSGIYELVRPAEDVRLVVVQANPLEESAPFRAGAFHGVAFDSNLEPGEDCICIQVGIPGEELEEIFRQWQSNRSLGLSASIALQSFSFEVDDALREWYHPRDLFIHGFGAPAALLKLRSKWTSPVELVPNIPEEQSSYLPPEIVSTPRVVPDQYNSPHISGIKHALWLIAVLAFLHLFK